MTTCRATTLSRTKYFSPGPEFPMKTYWEILCKKKKSVIGGMETSSGIVSARYSASKGTGHLFSIDRIGSPFCRAQGLFQEQQLGREPLFPSPEEHPKAWKGNEQRPTKLRWYSMDFERPAFARRFTQLQAQLEQRNGDNKEIAFYFRNEKTLEKQRNSRYKRKGTRWYQVRQGKSTKYAAIFQKETCQKESDCD